MKLCLLYLKKALFQRPAVPGRLVVRQKVQVMPNVDSPHIGPILVVDDEKFFRDLISNVLMDEGYEVRVAGSGEEALKALLSGRTYDELEVEIFKAWKSKGVKINFK